MCFLFHFGYFILFICFDFICFLERESHRDRERHREREDPEVREVGEDLGGDGGWERRF